MNSHRHKHPNKSRNHHNWKARYKGISKRNKYWHSTPEQRTHKKSDCFGALLTNAQCHMEPILILVYIESWTIKLKHTNETLSGTPLWSHKVLVCICFSERVYFNQLKYIYNIWYVYNNEFNLWTRTKVIKGKHIAKPTGFVPYSCFDITAHLYT